MWVLRPEFSPLKEVTRGVYCRLKASANERGGQLKTDPRPDPDQSQQRKHTVRDACHRLKVSVDRISSRRAGVK